MLIKNGRNQSKEENHHQYTRKNYPNRQTWSKTNYYTKKWSRHKGNDSWW